MKATRIIIKNLFGIKELKLDGSSVELTGPKGSGKTSVLDAIRYNLTNRSDRDYVVHKGEDEGEIIIETDTGLSIDRRVKAGASGTVKVRDGELLRTRPAEFLNGIFTPLQLDPVQFTQMSRQEKNRVILSLIDFQWDLNWIQEQFGEIPQGVDYSKHILEVLSDIQSESGIYYQSRQALNRDARNKQAFISDIAKDIPSNYNAARWEAYPIGEKYRELSRIQESNARIERARSFRSGYDAQLRGLDGERASQLAAIDRETSQARTRYTAQIERLQAELDGLDRDRDGKIAVVEAQYREKVANLERGMAAAGQYGDAEPEDTAALSAEINEAEEMRSHLNEYHRMESMQKELDALTASSEELTRKIELARELPSQILAQAKLPVEGLTVENGVPLIHGLPISNLSDGELLELCVDITVSRPGQLGIILVDGAERLDTESRQKLYERCKDKGLQIIATRVTDSDALDVVVL